MSQTVLEAVNITKRYGGTTALNSISVHFDEGKIYGLLGRNGAGKTTLLNIITSKAFAQSGEVRAFGESVVENPRVLPKICYMPEKNLFSRHSRVKDILRFAAVFYDGFDRPFADELCKKFALNTRKQYQALSRGYESILRIVIGMASRAPVTIFDEPVLGLDAAVREDFYRILIDDFARFPRTFIISTHMIEESAEIFNEAVIVREGKLVEQTSTEQLRDNSHYVTGKQAAVEEAVAGLNILSRETMAGTESAAVYSPLSEEKQREILGAGLEISPVPLQKLFIYMTGR